MQADELNVAIFELIDRNTKPADMSRQDYSDFLENLIDDLQERFDKVESLLLGVEKEEENDGDIPDTGEEEEETEE